MLQLRGWHLTVDVEYNPRLLATDEAAGNNRRIKARSYRLLLGGASDDLPESVEVAVPESAWSAATAALSSAN